MAEIALDFEHQARDAALRVLCLPAEELAGERAHAGRRLTRADRAADEDAGVQAQLGDDEPLRRGDFPDGDRMVHLADDDGGGGIGLV